MVIALWRHSGSAKHNAFEQMARNSGVVFANNCQSNKVQVQWSCDKKIS